MLRNSQVLYTSIEIIHLLGFAFLVGTILMVDAGLLGIGMGRQPVPRIAEGLAPWTWGGLVVMALSFLGQDGAAIARGYFSPHGPPQGDFAG